MEKTISDWETLKTFNMEYKGVKMEVRLVRHQGNSGAEWFFEIDTPAEKHLLLSKRTYLNNIIWIGGGIDHKEAQEMGPEIEKELGHPISFPESINPFEYKGDLEIRITRFLLGDITVEKAKNAYSPDIWYRVYLSDIPIVVVYAANFDKTGFSWLVDSPSNLHYKHFEKITGLIDLYEKKREDNH